LAKENLTPLDKLEGISAHHTTELGRVGVTSVEELVGLMHSSPDRLRDLLHLDHAQFEQLKRDAPAVLPAETRKALAEPDLDPKGYGAFEPEAD
jgi:predicted RecB family nuclease